MLRAVILSVCLRKLVLLHLLDALQGATKGAKVIYLASWKKIVPDSPEFRSSRNREHELSAKVLHQQIKIFEWCISKADTPLKFFSTIFSIQRD
ncbi:hypothetical protein BDR03DRAFT_965084 [Suillus americanus]|nr:hypothetical protein BDR03DRAFT_965084 [Suillus americanus]